MINTLSKFDSIKNVGALKVLPPALVIGCFLVLAMRARGAPLTKTDGKY